MGLVDEMKKGKGGGRGLHVCCPAADVEGERIAGNARA
ncbi:MAG: hypothetical protein ETSY1_45790 [Candidatus Entotheonella factor]|uniref:Uncharacterized protein n=1 Tax=Entotheonella factor TaxID=1429438 RepID=W4L3S7_ENTF1|nr:MAG: hypothetical protein ETSY1_45790 [Candidatus Entotheonella factor]